MTLMHRYLNAVRFFLPRREQDDIVRELSENIQAELDDRAASLARPLGEAEVVDVLRRHGHPALVAARYAPQRHLVGPVLFPIYWLALQLGLAAALVVTVVVAVVTAAAHGPSVQVFIDELLAYPTRALIVFGWTTLGFAGVELIGAHTRIEPDWDPRRLPDWMAGSGRRETRLHDRIHAVVAVVFGALGIGWLLLVPHAHWLAFGPLAPALDFAPIWHTWYVPLVIVAAANVLADVCDIGRPRATTGAWLKIAALVCQALVALAISSGRVWVVAAPGAPGPVTPPDRFDALLAGINTAVGIGLAVVVLITLVEIAKQAWRLLRHHPQNALEP